MNLFKVYSLVFVVFVFLVGAESISAQEIWLPPKTIINMVDGKQFVLKDQSTAAFIYSGVRSGKPELVFYVNGKPHRIEMREMLNTIKRIDLLSPGLSYFRFKDNGGKMLITMQDGRIIETKKAFFNRMYLCKKPTIQFSEDLSCQTLRYSKIRSIEFVSNDPIKCPKGGKLWPPYYQYCPLDGVPLKEDIAKTATHETEPELDRSKDILTLKNGDTLSGELILSEVTAKTSYAALVLPIQDIDTIQIEGGGQNVDIIQLANGDKLSGAVGPSEIKFKIVGQEVSIGKDKIASIKFRPR